jgi:hypothetical protein
MYLKKETANIIEVDSKSDLSQYSISIIRVLILVSNSKGKKILKNALIDYRATISLINPKTRVSIKLSKLAEFDERAELS